MDMQDFSGHDVDFALVLEEIFGARSSAFSDELRELLKEMWGRGIEFGAYAQKEKVGLPDEVVVPSRFEMSRATKKVEEMLETREKIIEMAETVALRMESSIDPTPIRRLEGDSLTKGVHNFLTRTARIKKRLADLLREVEMFRVFEA